MASPLYSGEQTLTFQALWVGRAQRLMEGLLSSSQQHCGRALPFLSPVGEETQVQREN